MAFYTINNRCLEFDNKLIATSAEPVPQTAFPLFTGMVNNYAYSFYGPIPMEALTGTGYGGYSINLTYFNTVIPGQNPWTLLPNSADPYGDNYRDTNRYPSTATEESVTDVFEENSYKEWWIDMKEHYPWITAAYTASDYFYMGIQNPHFSAVSGYYVIYS